MPTAKAKAPRKAKVKRAAPRKKAVAAEEPTIVVAPKAPVARVSRHTGTYAVGRRKSAVARVWLHAAGKGTITINHREFAHYFPVANLQRLITAPLITAGMSERVDVVALVRGGGSRGQAESVRLGIARALIIDQPELRPTLKPQGFLTRDPRVKERKKYGLKRARRAPQWQKR
jgi:small subunit ribosomal protein S9